MKIKSIHIKNVRGLGDRKIELNMIPNKPSLLVAPNGYGKSSFAFAFQWLNRQRMKLSADDAYMGNVENKPCMIIETADPSEIFVADEMKNEISRKFGIYVINSGLTAIPPGMHGGFQMGKAHITVPEIVLIDHIPQKKQLIDDFTLYVSCSSSGLSIFSISESSISLYNSTIFLYNKLMKL